MRETTAKVFVDGFGGMALVDTNDTHQDVIQALNNESIWEIFDGIEKLERNEYLVKLDFWWESNFPEVGGEFVTEIKETIKASQLGGDKSKHEEECEK